MEVAKGVKEWEEDEWWTYFSSGAWWTRHHLSLYEHGGFCGDMGECAKFGQRCLVIDNKLNGSRRVPERVKGEIFDTTEKLDEIARELN
jgi:hypothetical protein